MVTDNVIIGLTLLRTIVLGIAILYVLYRLGRNRGYGAK